MYYFLHTLKQEGDVLYSSQDRRLVDLHVILNGGDQKSYQSFQTDIILGQQNNCVYYNYS